MIVGAVMADRWDDDVRLSDLEPRFTCTACGKRGADVRPDFNWNKTPVRTTGYPDVLVASFPHPDPCVYRKLKLGRSDGEVRQGWRVIRCFRFAEPDEKPAHPCSRIDAF